MGKIILYYKYVGIEYPKRILKWQKKLCADLGLRGRVIIGHEGINGTVGGSDESIDRYMHVMKDHEFFADIDFKVSEGDADYFPRMAIKVRNEICALGIDPQVITAAQGGRHLSPDQVHQLLSERPEDLVVLDARNNFEWRIGSFKDAIKPNITNFRELPAYIDATLDTYKDKRVLMFCTGGIRCERATAYLNTKGIAKEVMQIDGGIVRYTEAYPDGFFRGKNYVFDRRVALTVTDDVLTHCDLCPQACDTYTNCLNSLCNKHYISCLDCKHTFNNSCSVECYELVKAGKVIARDPFIQAPEQRVVVRDNE